MKLPLYNIHKEEGAKFFTYAGWRLPLLYRSIILEHQFTRIAVGLTDISYMSKIEVRGEDRFKLIERLFTRNVKRMRVGSAYYGFTLNERGGIAADSLLFVREGLLYLTSNPLNRRKMLRLLAGEKRQLSVEVRDVTQRDVILSLQGRRAAIVLQRLTDVVLSDVSSNKFVEGFFSCGVEMIVSRTSYTGGDGFELIFPRRYAEKVWSEILEVGTDLRILPVGMGARSTLRIEAVFLLYGKEMSEKITPLEADMEKVVSYNSDFIGRDALLNLAERGGQEKRLVALEVESRRIARDGSRLFKQGVPVGYVTRGAFSPTLDKNIGLAYVKTDEAKIGNYLEVEIRDRRVSALIRKKPFYLRKEDVK